MTEYIEREAAINQVLSNDIDNSYPRMDIVARLHDLPAANVREVVHGKWEPDRGRFGCSCCGGSPIIDKYDEPALSDFCPHCGADMRGGNNG